MLLDPQKYRFNWDNIFTSMLFIISWIIFFFIPENYFIILMLRNFLKDKTGQSYNRIDT